ncbi:MAG TPA: GAF domain-containing protein, partial [Cryptosporangiaceae bacterium]|nr:GAF domain-containing protein [Cryptosporangiaceae bacterium]
VLEALARATGVAESGRVIAGIASLLGCDMTRLAVLDRATDRLRTVPVERAESVTTWAVNEAPTAALVVDTQVLGQVLASTICPDAGERHLLARAGSRSLLMLPLVSAGRTVGLMACFRRHERPWSRTELRSARTFAAAAGPVLASLATVG